MRERAEKLFASNQAAIRLSNHILIAAVAGILAGIFFGNSAGILMPIGNIYTMLLQVAVFPYIICSLLTSLGKLSPRLSFRLLKHGWMFYVCLILLTFGVIFILSRTFPSVTFSAVTDNPTSSGNGQSLLQLIIPENFFAALANNYVPAVVVFCILFGVMLQRVKKKENTLFKLLELISSACLEYWSWLVKLAPYMVFILIADVAGNINLDQLRGLSEFIILFFVGALLLAFWLIPIIISSFTGIRYRDLLTELRSPLIIAAATSLSILSLPYIKTITHKFLTKRHLQEADSDDVIETVLLVGYPLAHLGNLFMYLFMLFAALYFNHPYTQSQSLLLPFATYLSSIGAPGISVSAITFLSNWVNLPAGDAFNLYDSISPLIRYGQVLVSVMGFAFLTILITFAWRGKLQIQIKKLLLHFALAAIVLITFVYAFKGFIPDPAMKLYQRLYAFEIGASLTKDIKMSLQPAFDESKVPATEASEDSFFRIQNTGVLRVGYNADDAPFVYINSKGQLVGYDVAYMYALARALNARLEFIPFTWPYVVNDLKANKFDIVIGGIYVTEKRLKDISYSSPYYRTHFSFLIPKTEQHKFRSIKEILNSQLKIGIFNEDIWLILAQQYLPDAPLVIMPRIDSSLLEQNFLQYKIDGMLWTQEHSQIWILNHPNYSSVSFSDLGAPIMIAYMVQRNSPQFLNFLNYWLEMKQNDGFQKKIYDHFILMHPSQDLQPRWSIMRNILHWEI